MPKKSTPDCLRSKLDNLRFVYTRTRLFLLILSLSFLSLYVIDRFALCGLCFNLTLSPYVSTTFKDPFLCTRT